MLVADKDTLKFLKSKLASYFTNFYKASIEVYLVNSGGGALNYCTTLREYLLFTELLTYLLTLLGRRLPNYKQSGSAKIQNLNLLFC